MSTTDELLKEMLEDVEEYATPVTDDDLQFWIDEHLRVISIPKNGVVAGVEGDKNVNKIKFGMNRYYHGFDMSTFSGRILYSNAKGNKNYYNITDMQASGSAITFSWLVDADAVQYMGKTAFVVYLFKTQGSELRQKFYSTLATLKVLEGMEVDSAVPVEKQTDIIERMKEEISAYAEEVKKSLPADYTAMTEQVSSLKEDLNSIDARLEKLENEPSVPDSLISDVDGLKDDVKSLKSLYEDIYSRLFDVKDFVTDIPHINITASNWSGMTKQNAIDVDFSYSSDSAEFEGTANMKWQGSSSLSYDKKNFTIKLFADEAKTRKGNFTIETPWCKWKKANKFVLKANFIDHSHARNIVSARIWSEIVRSRTGYADMPSTIKTTPNAWEVDGFPVTVTVNGEYQGLYTFNIPKETWMFGVDSKNTNHAVVCAENNNSSVAPACAFRGRASLNGSDWSLEMPDELNPNILTSFNNAIDFVMNSTDGAFYYGLNNYIDVESAIDYYIYIYFGGMIDSIGKNQLLCTFDEKKWFYSMYDMDSTWGLFYTGTQIISPTIKFQTDYQMKDNLLFEKLERVFAKEIKSRYAELRSTILTESNICSLFNDFMSAIDAELYNRDLVVYPSIPLGNIDHLEQIRTYVEQRSVYVDGEIDKLVEHDYPEKNVTSVSLSKSSINLSLGDGGAESVDILKYGLTAGREVYNATEAIASDTRKMLTGSLSITDLDENFYFISNSSADEDTRVGVYVNGNIVATEKLSEWSSCLNLYRTFDSVKVYSYDYDGDGKINAMLYKVPKSYVEEILQPLDPTLVTATSGDAWVAIDVPNGSAIFAVCSTGWYGISGDGSVAKVNKNTGEIVALAQKPNATKLYLKVAVANVSNFKYAVVDLETLAGKRTDSITATVLPSDATNNEVIWTSSNPTSVGILSNGLNAQITALTSGTSVITATAKDATLGTKSAMCTVSVS